MPAGWTLTDIVCDDANSTGDLPNFEADFQLEAGETVKCTFYNLLPLDYGDAPDVNYQTLLASNGPAIRSSWATVWVRLWMPNQMASLPCWRTGMTSIRSQARTTKMA